MSQSIVFLLLALVWVGYLAVWWRDSRRISSHRSDRMPSFGRGLGSLGGSAARSASATRFTVGLVPKSPAAAAQRRREVLIALGVLAAVTLLGAVALGPVFLLVHVVVDIALAAYAYACVQRRHDVAEREMKVTMLYPDRGRSGPIASAPAPLRRTANG